MKKIILVLFLSTLSSNLFSSQFNYSGHVRKECFEFENQHLNVKLYKKDNYQIAYQVDDGKWVTVEVNWRNACKYSIKFLFRNTSTARKDY